MRLKSSMKFSKNVCPICDKVLKLKQINKNCVFECSTKDNNIKSSSHYTVEVNKDVEMQHINMFPFIVFNTNKSKSSKLYQYNINNELELLLHNNSYIPEQLKKFIYVSV